MYKYYDVRVNVSVSRASLRILVMRPGHVVAVLANHRMSLTTSEYSIPVASFRFISMERIQFGPGPGRRSAPTPPSSPPSILDQKELTLGINSAIDLKVGSRATR